jgi:hypothetical protein
MTIDFGPEGVPHGTLDSFFDVFFDVRLGSLSGPIILSDSLTLTANGVPWSHFPPPGAVEIPGVNTFLSGQDRSEDFFPVGTFAESNPVATYVGSAATVPEPSTFVMGVVFGVIGLFHCARNRLKRRA